MQYPTFIRARQLDDWAGSPAAKALLPELVGRLVFATVAKEQLQKNDFPAEAETHRPQYDGTTVTDGNTQWVPQGIGYWELGCEKDAEKKANDDYSKRIKEHEERLRDGVVEDLSQATLIIVTARDWHAKKPRKKTDKSKTTPIKNAATLRTMADWAAAKTNENRFKKVIAYDSNQLEQWIRQHPAVGHWLAREMGNPISGANDVETHWLNIVGTMKVPSLPPEALLVNREGTAKAFQECVDGLGRELSIRASSSMEVAAVFVAWIKTLPENEADAISSRALIVDDRETWKSLAKSQNPLILIPSSHLDAEPELFSEAQRNRHTVLKHVGTRSGNRPGIHELERMRRFDLEQALKRAGIDETEARRVAQGAGGNFTILKRVYAKDRAQEPKWAPEIILASLLLAGAWEDERPADQEIISRLSGKTYAEARFEAQKWQTEADPPLRLVRKDRGNSKVWEFLSPLDAWEFLAWNISPLQMQTFGEVAVLVLTDDNPALDLPADERVMAAIQRKVPKYSHDLRQGIAEILAIGATRDEESGIASTLEFSVRTGDIVRQILPPYCSWKRWASLGGLLSSLAEAAPEIFLLAVEEDLDSTNPQLIEVLRQEIPPSGVDGVAYHSGLLWALETLAWPTQYVSRARSALARLAENDPGGRWANRPEASTSRIFFSWRPQTVAPFGDRIEDLTILCQETPKTGWKVLLDLIPHLPATFFDSAKPTYRDWAAGWTGEVESAEFYATIQAATELAVEIAEKDPAKWEEYIDKIRDLHQVSATAYEYLRIRFSELAPNIDAPAIRARLWTKIEDLSKLHRHFHDADWALPPTEVQKWESIGELLIPSDSVSRFVPIFRENWLRDLDESFTNEQKQERRDKERREAIRYIYAENGPDGICSLAGRSENPWGVGHAAGEELGNTTQETWLPGLLTAEDENLAIFVRGYGSNRIIKNGTEWAKALRKREWTPDQTIAWAVLMPFSSDTWDWIEKLDATLALRYWKITDLRYGRGLTIQEVYRAIESLKQAGRAWDILQFVESRKDIESPVHTQMLCDVLESVRQTDPHRTVGTMDTYYLGKILSFLQSDKSGANKSRVAGFEMSFLTLLEYGHFSPKILHDSLATDPELFVEAIKILFKPRSQKKEVLPKDSIPEALAQKRRQAEAIWHLLRRWNKIPGTDDTGQVIEEELSKWVNSVRALAKKEDRIEMADHQIGQLFAKSRPDADEAPPLIPIRNVIEITRSTDLERGFEIGLHNLRGIVSKSLHEGGQQERDLAMRYEEWANSCREWPRTAKILKAVGKHYLSEAKREDERAEATD